MSQKDFEEEYKRLNAKQKEAVDAIEGPVMVIAGPGTGKTTILTLRIANILRLTDTPPNGILALTFTDAAAKNMRLKLRQIMGSRADEVRIHTFHGFAASVISEYDTHFPSLSRATLITDVEAESLIREILKDPKFSKLRPLGEPDFYVPKILSAISESKKESWTPEILSNFAESEIKRVEEDTDSISTRGQSKGGLKAEAKSQIEKAKRSLLLADAYQKYEEEKVRLRLMDYDDQLFELLKALREDKLLLQILQEQFLYILVDEHQDTNDTQNNIVRMIADFFESPNLFVVGDEKQAIYRFQGASIANFLNFQKIWPEMKVISLNKNYRSGQSILDAAHKMISKNSVPTQFQDLRIRLEAFSQLDHPIQIISAENSASEEKFLVDKIKELLSDEPGSEIAVILRRNREVDEILRIFDENDIAAKAERSADIFSHPVSNYFFSLAEYLSDPSKVESLAKTLSGDLWNLSLNDRALLIKDLRRGETRGLSEALPNLEKLRVEATRQTPVSYLSLIAQHSGLLDLIKRDALSTEVWRAIINIAKGIESQGDISDPIELLKKLLEYRQTAEHKFTKLLSGAYNAPVSVMTAHGSKGLEFDYVFIPKATEDLWIGRRRGEYFALPHQAEIDKNVEDERRLFYVSLTRAKKIAIVSTSIEGSQGKVSTPIRFLSELDEAFTKHIDLPRVEPELKTQTLDEFNDASKKKENEYAKSVLIKTGLSVTALNHFLTSHDEFFEKYILKVPEAPTASTEKGTCMHLSISNIWKIINENEQRKKISQSEIEKLLKDFITEYFGNSYLPKYERDPLVEKLLDDAPALAACLKPHFETEGEVLTESFVETPFEYQFNGEKIQLNLKGRLDTVIVTSNDVQVYDYKTKQGMSERAIRGETQSGDGKYFRQLAFYKLLLAGARMYQNKNFNFSLFFISPDERGNCPIVTLNVTEEDVKKVESEIKNLLDTVWQGKLRDKSV